LRNNFPFYFTKDKIETANSKTQQLVKKARNRFKRSLSRTSFSSTHSQMFSPEVLKAFEQIQKKQEENLMKREEKKNGSISSKTENHQEKQRIPRLTDRAMIQKLNIGNKARKTPMFRNSSCN